VGMCRLYQGGEEAKSQNESKDLSKNLLPHPPHS
jgi:hypothetical protein